MLFLFAFTTNVVSVSCLLFRSTTTPLSSRSPLQRVLSSTTTTTTSMTTTTEIPFFTTEKEAQTFVSEQVLLSSLDNTTKCGQLACQYDSLLQTMETSQLLSYASFQEKAKKKQKDPSPLQYTLVLSDSVFFPEGGGQPCDAGTIRITSNDNKELNVTNAQNINGICVLTCRRPATDPNESSSSLFQAAGTTPTISQHIDWDHRLDVMTQHSGQHLLSAIAMNDHDMATHSFRLGQGDTSYIDFIVPADMTEADYTSRIRQLETSANDAIRKNLSMTPTWLDPADPAFAQKVRSRLLPAGLTGKIRLVEIGNGLDCNTCCGTHVPTLGLLQMIKCFKLEKAKSTILRVTFAAGPRLLRILQSDFARQSHITNLLSCAADDHVTRIATLLEDKKQSERTIKALQAQVCQCKAAEVVQELQSGVAVLDLSSTSGADMAFMTLLSNMVLEQQQVDDDDDKNIILLFVSGDDDDTGSFLLSGNNATLVQSFGKTIVAPLLGGRGGGGKFRFQGKGTKIQSALPSVKEALIEALLKEGV